MQPLDSPFVPHTHLQDLGTKLSRKGRLGAPRQERVRLLPHFLPVTGPDPAFRRLPDVAPAAFGQGFASTIARNPTIFPGPPGCAPTLKARRLSHRRSLVARPVDIPPAHPQYPRSPVESGPKEDAPPCSLGHVSRLRGRR